MGKESFEFLFRFLLVGIQTQTHNQHARKSTACLDGVEINAESHADFDGAIKIRHPFHFVGNENIARTIRLELIRFWCGRIRPDD